MQHQAGHDQLPLVIPLLFYQGQVSPYPYSMRWLDSFETPELASQLYAGGFPLVEVTVISDDENHHASAHGAAGIAAKAYPAT